MYFYKIDGIIVEIEVYNIERNNYFILIHYYNFG